MVYSFYEFLAEDGDEAIIGWLWKGLLCLIAISSFVKVPYGKNSYGTGGGLLQRMILVSVTVPARLGWFMMELPALAMPLFLLFSVGGRYVGSLNPNMILLGMFILHYINRRVHVMTLCQQASHVIIASLFPAQSIYFLSNSAWSSHANSSRTIWNNDLLNQRLPAGPIPNQLRSL